MTSATAPPSSPRGHIPTPQEAVVAATAALAARRVDSELPVEVLRVELRVVLRQGERAYVYLVGPDGKARLEPSDEKDGGRRMVPPPRGGT